MSSFFHEFDEPYGSDDRPVGSLVTPPSTSHTPPRGPDPDADLQKTADSGLPFAPRQDDRPLPSHDPAVPPPDGPTDTGFGPVLRNGQFLRLWLGQVFSQIADKVYLVLMIMLISHYFETPGESISSWVSAIMVAFTIPAVFLGSIAGVYVDRHPKKLVLVLSNLLRGALVLTLPVLLPLSLGYGWHGMSWGFNLLLLITFSVSVLTQFFAPAEQAVIPLVVEKPLLLSANSLYTTTMMGAMIVGFAVGEPLLQWADTTFSQMLGADGGAIVFVGSCYGVAGVLLLGLRDGEAVQQTNGPLAPFWQDIREGLAYLRQNDRVRSALIQLVILFSVFAALAVLAVRLAEVMPQLSPDQFGWILAMGSVGMGLGALLLGNLGDRWGRDRVVQLGNYGMAASLLALAVLCYTNTLDHLLAVLGAIGSLGLFAALIGIPLQTTIQEYTPSTMRGKVFGLQNNGVNIALSLPLVLAGVAEQTLGLGCTFTILAIAVILGGLWEYRSPH